MGFFSKNIFWRFSRRKREAVRAAMSHPFDTCVTISENRVNVGKYTYGVGNIELAYHPGCPELSIGRYCSIAGNVKIFLGAYHRTDWISTYPFGTKHTHVFGSRIQEGFPYSNGPVSIGNDVWIGNSVTIMSGVTIGDGAVLAANSHVIKDVQAYEMVGGNPARHIRLRFDAETINQLLVLRWWEFDDNLLKDIVPLLNSKPNTEIMEKLLKIRLSIIAD